MNYSLINDKLVLEENALISIKERGFRFSDGVFETCKVYDGAIYDFNSHLKRLKIGLDYLQIKYDLKNLSKQAYNLIKNNNLQHGSIRISISRGIGSMGYLPSPDCKPLLVIETNEERKITAKKIILGVSKIKAAKHNRIEQKCKLTQSLNYILAKINAKKVNHFDDILLNDKGFISEVSSANIFWVKKGKIYTPSKDCNMLFGSVRQKILDKFPMRINLVKSKLSSLLTAEEIFITNSNHLVLAIDEVQIFNQKITLKKTLSNQILEWFKSDVKKYADKINNEK